MTGFLLMVGCGEGGAGVFFGIVGPGIQISFAWLRRPFGLSKLISHCAAIRSRRADIGGGVQESGFFLWEIMTCVIKIRTVLERARNEVLKTMLGPQ